MGSKTEVVIPVCFKNCPNLNLILPSP